MAGTRLSGNGRSVGPFSETVGRSTGSPSKNSTTSTSTTSAPLEIYCGNRQHVSVSGYI